jgi:hypothetical protein
MNPIGQILMTKPYEVYDTTKCEICGNHYEAQTEHRCEFKQIPQLEPSGVFNPMVNTEIIVGIK